MSFYNGKEYHWICRFCGKDFGSRNKLKLHYKQNPTHKIKKSSKNNSDIHRCRFCGKEWKTTKPGLSLHEKSCAYNENRVPGQGLGKKMSEEFRKKRSENMLERHLNGTAFTFADLRRRTEPSYPEKWLIKVIENNGIDNNYIREYRFHTFSLDFCWPEKKKVIEMDGRLHDISSYQKDCDKRKDALLKDEGYKLLRIKWKECINNPTSFIQKIKEFIG